MVIGSNPEEAKSRFNTDLTGGLEEAKAMFDSLTKGQPVKTEITDRGVTRITADDGTQLRLTPNGDIRIDRPISIKGKYRETIHFRKQ